MRKVLPLLVLAACGPAIDTTTAPSHFGTESSAETVYPTLPQWQHLAVVAHEEMRDKGSNDPWELLTTKVDGYVETVSQGAKPQLAFHPCRIILPEVSGIQPELPDTTVQALAPVAVEAVWEEKADGTFRLSTPAWTAVVFGANLAQPTTDALPTSKNDSRVVDLDADNKPGVTMKASIGRLYMVMRGLVRLDGTFDPKTPEAGLQGSAEYTRDFYIFGDNVFGVAKAQVEKAYANSETRPAASTGTLKKIDSAAPTCADVLQ